MPEIRNAFIRSLSVRPFYSIDLSFAEGGIIGKRHARARLGADIGGFDFEALIYSQLLSMTGHGTATKIKYTADYIHNEVAQHTLFELRNQVRASELTAAILKRNIQFLQKYAHIQNLVGEWQSEYADKYNKLIAQRGHVVERHESLVRLYQGENQTGAEKPESDSFYFNGYEPESNPDPGTKKPVPIRVRTETETVSTPVGMYHGPTLMVATDSKWGSVHSNATLPFFTSPCPVPSSFILPSRPMHRPFTSQTNYSEMFVQRTVRHDGDYRNPYEEELTRFNNEMAALAQEIIDSFTFNQRLGHLEEIWEAELAGIHEEIRQLQLRYVETFLLPPISEGTRSGIITAIYKDVGEPVQPGEPVVRIENADRILVTGIVNYRGNLSLGLDVTLEMKGVFEGEPQVSKVGRIVSIRGHDSDNDIWDIIIECENAADRLPINYSFEPTPDDYDVAGAHRQGSILRVHVP